MQRLLTIFVLFCASSAFCQTDLREVGPKDAYALPLFIVSPVFPGNISPDSLPVEIRVTGTVTLAGKFKEPAFSPAEGKAPFVQSILDVLPGWRFRPAIDGVACNTKESQAVVIVYFEFKDGKPSISISSPVHREITGVSQVFDGKSRGFARRPKTTYPISMSRRGIEGTVEVLVKADGEGEIVAKRIIYSIPSDDFGEAVLDALKPVTFTKDTPPSSTNVCYTYLTLFCMASGVDFPDPKCHRK